MTKWWNDEMAFEDGTKRPTRHCTRCKAKSTNFIQTVKHRGAPMTFCKQFLSSVATLYPSIAMLQHLYISFFSWLWVTFLSELVTPPICINLLFIFPLLFYFGCIETQPHWSSCRLRANVTHSSLSLILGFCHLFK